MEDRLHDVIVDTIQASLLNQLAEQGYQIYRDNAYGDNVLCPDLVITLPGSSKSEASEQPLMIVEVMSDESEVKDRGYKWQLYRKNQFLLYYLLVDSASAVIELYRRDGSNWINTLYEGTNELVSLAYLNCSLSMQTIYGSVELTGKMSTDESN